MAGGRGLPHGLPCEQDVGRKKRISARQNYTLTGFIVISQHKLRAK